MSRRHEDDCTVALDWLESSGETYVKIGRVELWRLADGTATTLFAAGPREAIRPAQLRAFITGESFTWVGSSFTWGVGSIIPPTQADQKRLADLLSPGLY